MKHSLVASNISVVDLIRVQSTRCIRWNHILAMFVLVASSASIPQATINARLAISNNRDAVYFINGKHRMLVKKVEDDQEIQAYKILNNNSVFVAYSYYSSGPGTIISIVTMNPHREHIIGDLGGTQDITFALNPVNNLVVFNQSDSLYKFDVDKAELIPEDNNRFHSFEKSLSLIYKCEFRCYSPIWLDSSTLSFIEQKSVGPDVHKSIKVSE